MSAMSAVSPMTSQAFASGSGAGRTVINAIAGYANLAKGFGFASDPANSDTKGYPIRTPTTPWLANPRMPEGYFGDFVWKFRGRGSMQLSPGAIIRSGGLNIHSLNGNSGDTDRNTTIADKTNPRVVFSFGAVVQNMSPSPVSNGDGGRRIRLTFKPSCADHASSVIRVQAPLQGYRSVDSARIWNLRSD